MKKNSRNPLFSTADFIYIFDNLALPCMKIISARIAIDGCRLAALILMKNYRHSVGHSIR